MRDGWATAGREFVAPARVNLIGEHTDYTGGLVFPMAIPFTTTVTVVPSAGEYRFESEGFGSVREMGLEDRSGAVQDWSDYPVGVLRQMQARGIAVPGFRMTVRGDVPLGAGLSSSASIEVATAVALLDLCGERMEVGEIAKLCQRAENEYVGSPCGIMDQFAVAAGTAHHALMLETRDLQYDLVPMYRGEMAECCVVVANSMVKHSIAGGDYGLRRREVEAGQAVLREGMPALRDLGDATVEDVEAHRAEMSAESYKRCLHIVSENDRVREARDAMRDGNARRMGEAMVRSHESQRDLFECSVGEIDFLVERAVGLSGCFGARLTGGGFGGSTVNLVRVAEAEAFGEALREAYWGRFGMECETYVCEAADGAVARAAAGEREAEK